MLSLNSFYQGWRAFIATLELGKKFFKTKHQNKSNNYKKNVDSNTYHFEQINLAEDKKMEVLHKLSSRRNGESTPYESAFSSHAYRNSQSNRVGLLNKKKSKKIIAAKSTNDKATLLFHYQTKFRVPFMGSIKDHTKPKSSSSDCDTIEDQIFDDLTRMPKSQNANEVTLICSDIGDGKSTLLSNLLYRIHALEAKHRIQRPKGFLPINGVKVSFEKIPLPIRITKDEEYIGTLNKNQMDEFASKYVESHILAEVKKQIGISGETLEEIVNDKGGQQLVILFDDLDQVYKLYCKVLMTRQDEFDPSQGLDLYFPFLLALIKFFGSGEFSKLGVRCVFAIRHDTLRMLQKSMGPSRGGKPAISKLRAQYSLKNIDGSNLLDLIKKRFELAVELEKNENNKKIMRHRISLLNNKITNFEAIAKTGVEGLRHTIFLVQQLEWTLLDRSSFDRFFGGGNDLLIYFLCSGKKYFSQVNYGITNIFLVNIGYRRSNNPKLCDGRKAFSKEFLTDHKHTYFLKYLILHYIDKMDNADRYKVLNTFTQNDGYEKNLVELVLFSLTEEKHGRLIRPSVMFSEDAELSIINLQVTSRGKHFIKNDLFWHFDYLSLVAGDYWLEVPFALFKDFSNPPSLDHIVEQDYEKYKRKLSNYLKDKAKVVPMFLNLLEFAFAQERKAKVPIFKVLESRNVPLPNFDVIKVRCKRQLEKKCSVLNEEEKSEILDIFETEISKKSLRALRKKVYPAFKSTY